MYGSMEVGVWKCNEWKWKYTTKSKTANPAKNVKIQRMYVLLQESMTTYDFLIGFFLTINDTSVLTRFDKDLK